MNNQLTATTSRHGYALASLPHLFVFISFLFFFQSCRKQQDVLLPPKVVSTSPITDETELGLETNIAARFSTSMDSASVCKSFRFQTQSQSLKGEITFRDSVLNFIPENDLLPNTTYTVVIGSAAADSKGQKMEADYIFHFTTKGPDRFSMTKTSDSVTAFLRDGSKVMQIGEYLYSFGGWANPPEESYSDVYRSTDLTNWERRPDAPWHGRHVFGIAKLNNAVFVLGGDNLHSQFDVWRTTDGENWVQLADNILDNRMFYGCTAHNGYLYIVGGLYHQDVWRSADGITWTKMVDNITFLNGENFSGSLASFNGRLWMVCGGGQGGGDGTPRKSVWSSADGTVWKQEPDFPGCERYYTDVCVWDNKLWVVGGYNYSERNIKSIWYMTSKGTWTELETPNDYIGRHATAVGVFKNQLAIVNGNYHNDCWAIQKMH